MVEPQPGEGPAPAVAEAPERRIVVGIALTASSVVLAVLRGPAGHAA